MALAFLINIPFFVLFVPKTCEIGSTGEPWELAGVHVNADKLELLFAWQNKYMYFEQNVLWGGKSASFYS